MIRNEVTPRQFQIVLLVSRGWSNKRIADHFYRTEHGVKNSIREILYRTGTASRLELSVRLAWEEGWYGQGNDISKSTSLKEYYMGMYPDLSTMIANKYREKLTEGKSDKDATKEILEDALRVINTTSAEQFTD